jgi:hypothetical protein
MDASTFGKVNQPVGLFYFYKDKTHQDSTVKVSAELSMFDELATPASLKFKEAIPGAGTHVIGSAVRSHDVPAVEEGVSHFLSAIMHLPVPPPPGATGLSPSAAHQTASVGQPSRSTAHPSATARNPSPPAPRR